MAAPLKFLIAPVCAVLASPLWADPSLECSHESSQVEIASCVNETLERVEQALVIALGIARAQAQELDEVTKRTTAEPALDAAQEAWAKYRDTHCEYVGATYGGGSGTGIGIASCQVELGRARIDALMAQGG